MFYKTLQNRILQEIDIFRCNLVSPILDKPHQLRQTNTLAYYGVTLQILNVLQHRPLVTRVKFFIRLSADSMAYLRHYHSFNVSLKFCCFIQLKMEGYFKTFLCSQSYPTNVGLGTISKANDYLHKFKTRSKRKSFIHHGISNQSAECLTSRRHDHTFKGSMLLLGAEKKIAKKK